MADVITPTITYEGGCVKIVGTGFNGDGEATAAISMATYCTSRNLGRPFNTRYPKGKAFSITADQTAGTTAVIAVSVQGSLDGGTTWRDIVDITDCEATGTSDAMAGCAHDNDMLHATIPHIRIYVTTIGAGNTLTLTAWVNPDSP